MASKECMDFTTACRRGCPGRLVRSCADCIMRLEYGIITRRRRLAQIIQQIVVICLPSRPLVEFILTAFDGILRSQIKAMDALAPHICPAKLCVAIF